MTSLLMQLYLGRTLGPELYGVYGVINAFIVINEMMLMRGIYDTLSRFTAEKEEAASAILSVMLKATAVLGLTLCGLYLLFAPRLASLLNDPELSGYIKLSSFSILVSLLSTVYLGAFNGLRRFAGQALIFMVFSATRLVAVIALVYYGFAVKGVVIGLLISEIVRLIMARGLYRHTGTNVGFRSRELTGFALQLIIISFFSALVMYVDLLAVKAFIRKNLETGLYTSAVTISRISAILIMPVTLAMVPILSKAISEGDAVLTENRIRQALRLLLMLILPVSLIAIATSGECISFLYGDRYAQASTPLKILLAGGIFLSGKALMYSVIVAAGHPLLLISIGLFSLITEVVLLMLLLGKWGLSGAAAASTITHLLGFIVCYVYVSRRFMTRAAPYSLVRIIAASLLVYFAALAYSPKGFALLIFYTILIALFFSLLIIMKEIDIETVRITSKEIWGQFRDRLPGRSNLT